MIQTGFEQRVKIQQIIENQLPEFILSESPKTSEFLKQYYISQEYQGGPVDISDNLDQYLKLDNLTPEIINVTNILEEDITENSDTIEITSTKGFPKEYGLLKIDDEIITYTGITTNTFTGCIRGFSGISDYNQKNTENNLKFSKTIATSHKKSTSVQNLSSLFLKEFYKKIKAYITPGLENNDFAENLNVGNFIKNAKSFYQSKGTEESFKILFKVLYGETPKILKLQDFLIKPSSAEFIRRKVIITERISGDPKKLIGQTIKSSYDENAQASVSEVEVVTKNNKVYYKLLIFVGYTDDTINDLNFSITGKTRVIENIEINSNVISVDSTLGFPDNGTLVCGNNQISYQDKTINQFLGCSGVTEFINAASDIRSNQIVYGYENGDTSKKVELIITGVLSKFIAKEELSLIETNDIIGIKNLGEEIKNPEVNKTYKEIFANSWIYNSSSRFGVLSISGSTFILSNKPDKSNLKVGDYVDILKSGSQIVVASDAVISSINYNNNQVILSNISEFNLNENFSYDIRRKIKKAVSNGTPLKYGNNKLIANIQNLYVNDNYGYVASNSIPEYIITKNTIRETIPSETGSFIQGYDPEFQKYSIISFNTQKVQFITGDEVVYIAENEPLDGLENGGIYYVEVLPLQNQIRLYASKAFTSGFGYVQFSKTSVPGYHAFILNENKSNIIGPQKLLKKFPLKQNLASGKNQKTLPGPVGMLINGVEILNFSSNNKIYYGAIESIKIINSGNNYDVINPPDIVFSSPSFGVGSTALANVVVRGEVNAVYVDPQEFGIKDVVSVTLTGGNGNGASFKPILSEKYKEIKFDSRPFDDGGCIDSTTNQIFFKEPHYLNNGEAIVYFSSGSSEIGINLSINSNTTLIDGSIYYVKVINATTIRLYESFNDYYTQTNQITFDPNNSTAGIQKFRTLPKKTLNSIKILNPGKNYENRKLLVKYTGISTTNNTINFTNHNFNHGDIVTYSTNGTPISGLSTSNQYYILKIDNNSFKLANAGIGGTISENYQKLKSVDLNSQGNDYHIFSYPKIEVNVNVIYDNNSTGIITATPVVKGKIVDAYVYEGGSGYGSSTPNLQKTPLIKIKNGIGAELKPIISNGKIIKVEVLNGGDEYSSIPDLKIIGIGNGAILRAIIKEKKVDSVVVINEGIGYDANTVVNVIPSGTGAKFDSSITYLTINNFKKYGKEALLESKDNLQYYNIGYIKENGELYFDDTGLKHSPIIGWAYDGNPIYGPFGYSTPNDITSEIKLLTTGYTLNYQNVENRPSINIFEAGYFIEDYEYNNSGDLDIHNGRYCKTPEFPNGVYAYFATLNSLNYQPEYPYFIGNTYRSSVIEENYTLDQTFDLNNSGLLRNTLPHNISDSYVKNDFIIGSNERTNEISRVESVTKGSIDSIVIIESGINYKVGDLVNFDNTNTGGGGVSAVVSEVKGKTITSLDTQKDSYFNAIFTWKDKDNIDVTYYPHYNLSNGDYVSITGITTTLSSLNGFKKINISNPDFYLTNNIPSNSIVGFITDIYVSKIPSEVSVGSSIKIEDETLTVLNIFKENLVIRVKRPQVSVAHTATTKVSLLNNKLTISAKTNYFDSKLNQTVYFNPNQSIGVGIKTGLSSNYVYSIGIQTSLISIPTQSIYLPNHPFNTGDELIFDKSTGSSIIAQDPLTNSQFLIPEVGQKFFVINKSKNYIGLVTNIGFTTNTAGLFFFDNGTDQYDYSFTTNFNQITGVVEKFTSTITVNEEHQLQNLDYIRLNVVPKNSVGIGTTTPISLKFNENYQKLLINTLYFNSSNVDINTNKINIDSHKLQTGDKIFYDSTDLISNGLTTGSYFVYKHDNDSFSLSETFFDLNDNPPTFVNISSSGGSGQEISLINPKISVSEGSNILFDINNLTGYELKFYYDENFNNEIISSGKNSSFNVTEVDNIKSLNYDDLLDKKLYYGLEKFGLSINPDKEVKFYSQIEFTPSLYNNSYSISGIGSTTFNISLPKDPIFYSYNTSNTSKLEYFTKSKNTKGGISKLNILSGGYGYERLPDFISIASTEGTGANLAASSNSIGKVSKTRILEQGFNYSSDKTLTPESSIASIITINNSNFAESVEIEYPGSNYLSSPNLIIYDPILKKVVDNNSLVCEMASGSIKNVRIDAPIYGLASNQNKIYTVNNSNGISISTVSSTSSTVILTLSEPITGFNNPNLFTIGEQIFVENIQKEGSAGYGFNSSDYDYQFFEVTNYQPSPPTLTYKVPSNPGIAKSVQSITATVVKKENYPILNLKQKFSTFNTDETILVRRNSIWIETDAFIVYSKNNILKINGIFEFIEGDLIKGKFSGVVATIDKIKKNKGIIEIDYFNEINYGWSNNFGILDDDNQVIPNNDYYQNLSYSVKSSIGFNDFIDPVNRLLHPAGFKNFANTEIKSNVSIAASVSSTDLLKFSIVNENRVDVINNYDYVLDINVLNNQSKNIRLLNKKLTNYINCISNKPVVIDDISKFFSNVLIEQSTKGYVPVLQINDIDTFNRFLIQTRDIETNDVQFTEIITIVDNNNVFTFEKSNLMASKNSFFGEYISVNDQINDGIKYLKFSPYDIYNSDYDIKVLKTSFNSTLPTTGTQNIGCIDLVSINSTIGIGISSKITSFQKSNINSLVANIQVRETTTNEMNYVDLYITHDGNNVYYDEYYFDSSQKDLSFKKIGEFYPKIVDSELVIDFENNSETNCEIRTNIVGFGLTSLGSSTYRFINNDQTPGFERSALLVSNYVSATSSSPITFVDVNSDEISIINSLVKISYGSTVALHQVTLVHNGTDITSLQYPFISIGSTSGIGTFGGEYSGGNILLRFYPDSLQKYEIQSFSELIYKEIDVFNESPTLSYGSVDENIVLSAYNGINGNRVNRTSFNLLSNNNTIFAKVFNPQRNVDAITGIITVTNHYFSNGEELLYTAGSTLQNVEPYKITSVSGELPNKVYAIKLDSNRIKLATSRQNALSGIGITFVGIGTGNAHQLEMSKKMEKSIITLDGVVQKPLTYTPINYKLENSIDYTQNTFSLTGISSITPLDVLKIDDEYVVVNLVGFGTTSSGPINDIGNIPLVNVNRGSFGTISTSHTGLTTAYVYRGSYNITNNRINFATPPLGSPPAIAALNKNLSNLSYPSSTFSGRVFLKEDYTGNRIFDDISDDFTGIGQTYTLKYAGITTVGLGTTGGNGIVFINGIFQSPTTTNNSGNNFYITETQTESKIVFTGITSTDGTIVRSIFDVNQNQLPRGGLIVSLGSTSGLGFAPLVGVTSSSLNVTVGAGGSITSVSFKNGNYNCGSGYFGTVSIGITDSNHIGNPAIVNATVGLGGSLTGFNIVNGGSGYSSPYAIAPEPLYKDLPVIGVSRRGIGSTTETGSNLLLSLEVGPSPNVGVGSNLYEVKSFKITRPGYGFKVGDVFKPVGLVTDKSLGSPLENFEITVLETFQDSFFAYDFGELDYIDSIKFMQDGSRRKFPLYYNGELLSFYADQSFNASLGGVLIIFINGILQEPEISYSFNGGTNVTFSEPPKPEDVVSIFFYRGTRGVDSFQVDVKETIKIGDSLQIFKNDLNSSQSAILYEPLVSDLSGTVSVGSSIIVGVNTQSLVVGQVIEPLVNIIPFNSVITIIGNSYIAFNNKSLNKINTSINFSVGKLISTYDALTKTQNSRIVTNILSSDILETNSYVGVGIDETLPKPMSWEKQKIDRIINGIEVYKSRDSIEALIYPSSKLIWDLKSTDTQAFVDNAKFFEYEKDNYGFTDLTGISGIIINENNPVSAKFNVVVNSNGSITNISIGNSGSGYIGIGNSIELKISNPIISIGTTAKAFATITDGVITAPITIVNSGVGYSQSNPPQVIAPLPASYIKRVNIGDVEGFSGIITGIQSVTGTNGNPRALKFFLKAETFIGLMNNYPIYIYDTMVGSGVTSIVNNDSSIVGIGTSFLDNIYYISSSSLLNTSSQNAEIICNVKSDSNILGISTYGSSNSPIGKFSWGRLFNLTYPSTVSIAVTGSTVNKELLNYPTIQRKGYGLRDLGAIKKSSLT